MNTSKLLKQQRKRAILMSFFSFTVIAAVTAPFLVYLLIADTRHEYPLSIVCIIQADILFPIFFLE